MGYDDSCQHHVHEASFEPLYQWVGKLIERDVQ